MVDKVMMLVAMTLLMTMTTTMPMTSMMLIIDGYIYC